ncbi:hypothetical protein FIE12Z_2873 [Fusarium flagelliforme]|uniref:Uncharacterized protein n=1 Tax=Fusarium flagelliforme TaxID=2675880 RepID=A0A395MYT3_9HYPO|nr:hypothetical protein FIE12Z_2873 [Fusarium flagelliforme]
MLGFKSVVLAGLLTLGLAEDKFEYDPLSNFRPRNITGLGDFYGWVGSYYNATAEVELKVEYEYMTPKNKLCSKLKNKTTTLKYDAVLSVLERGPWNAGNNSMIFWLTLMPQTPTYNVSDLPTDFMTDGRRKNLTIPIYSNDPTPNGYWRPQDNSSWDKFNFTTTQLSNGAYSVNQTLGRNESEPFSSWANVTMPVCNSSTHTGDYRLVTPNILSYYAEDWDGYKNPELSMQFDDKTANLTLDGVFHATPYMRLNSTKIRPAPVQDGSAFIGYFSVQFNGVLDAYHSDKMTLKQSLPTWQRTVGFGNNTANIGNDQEPVEESAANMVSASVLTTLAVAVSFLALF